MWLQNNTVVNLRWMGQVTWARIIQPHSELS